MANSKTFMISPVYGGGYKPVSKAEAKKIGFGDNKSQKTTYAAKPKQGRPIVKLRTEEKAELLVRQQYDEWRKFVPEKDVLYITSKLMENDKEHWERISKLIQDGRKPKKSFYKVIQKLITARVEGN